MAEKGPDATVESAFLGAVAAYEEGRLGDAERALLNIQETAPDLPDVLHLLALIALRDGRADAAIGYLEKAVAAAPGSAGMFVLLGGALGRAGRADDSAEAYGKAVALDPGHADAHFNLANARRRQDRTDAAIEHYRRAVAADPGFKDAYFNLGAVLKESGRFDEAAEALTEAVRLAPADAEARLNLGNVLAAVGDGAGALAAYKAAIEARPDYAEAHFNLGNLLRDEGRLDDAIEAYRRAIDLDPDRAEYHNNLGDVLRLQGAAADALAPIRRALEIDPEMADAHNNLGIVSGIMGDGAAAIGHYRRALECDPGLLSAATNLGNALLEAGDRDGALAQHRAAVAMAPDSAEAHFNLGQALLVQGRLEEGWREFEWRWRVAGDEPLREFPQAPWRGEDVAGRTVLVWSEQGVGDEVLFAGMVPDLLARGATVVLECERRLMPLFERSFPGVACWPKETPPVAETRDTGIDFQVPGAGLGRWLRPTLASFPKPAPYLVADGNRTREFRTRYGGDDGDLFVGVAWYSSNDRIGSRKSMTLMDLGPVAETPGVRLVDLQYGDTGEERAAFEAATGVSIVHDDGLDQMADLDGFAAQVAAMDLVVSISNTTVHMAGGLGVEAWVMLNTVPLSCWMLDRDDSPWYGDLTLFRQETAGAWAPVVARVAERLRARVPG